MSLPPSAPLPSPLQTLFWILRPTHYMRWCQRHYGDAFRVTIPPYTVSLFSHPDAIRTIFAARSDDMHAGTFNRVLRTTVGDASVLLLDGREHIRERKLLMPSFHGARMRLYGETMADITRRRLATWRRGETFALHPHAQEITLDIILRTVFGADEGAELHALRTQIQHMMGSGESRLSLLALLAVMDHPGRETRAPFRWLLGDRRPTDALLRAQISARRNDPRSAERTDVLAMLLQARDEDGQGMSDQELRDELVTALTAGHETTATSLAWAFERILATPVVHARLRDEVRALGASPDPERLAALPYLDATVKEVLRLRPVIPAVGRVLQKPYTLHGYDMPAGSNVAACIYLAHLNPEVYPEPDAFKPERFVGVQPDPVHWLPFGGGTRRCIGAAFAQYEMKIVLGTILGSCDLQLAQPAPAKVVRRAVTYWPEGGTRVRLMN